MNTNPYESYSCEGLGQIAPKTETPDPPTRESLSKLIRAFLSSEITAFELDNQLAFYDECGDPIIQLVVDSIWYHYDDCDDHLVCMSIPEWDHVQRLLLVLAADCHIEQKTHSYWSWRQLIALTALIGFICCGLEMGWGSHLFIVAIPFGLVSIALAFAIPVRRKEQADANPYREIIYPFASLGDLAAAYHSVDFRKTRFPRHLTLRRIRSPAMDWFWMIHSFVIWMVFSPVPLLIQSLPSRETDTAVRAGVRLCRD